MVNSISAIHASQEVLVPTGQKGRSINEVVPSALIQKILEYLSLSEGCNTAPVCQLWNRVVQIRFIRKFGFFAHVNEAIEVENILCLESHMLGVSSS